jgi:hypothetical protein
LIAFELGMKEFQGIKDANPLFRARNQTFAPLIPSASFIPILHARWFWDTMGERIGRIETNFSCHSVGIFSRIPSTRTTEKIRFNPPDPPNPFSHCIPKRSDAPYNSNEKLLGKIQQFLIFHIPESKIIKIFFSYHSTKLANPK